MAAKPNCALVARDGDDWAFGVTGQKGIAPGVWYVAQGSKLVEAQDQHPNQPA